MIEERAKRLLDFRALKGAIEGKDPEALLALYAEDAELRIVNAALPDGRAFELRGRSQIERYLRAVCEQEMTCLLLEAEPAFGRGSVSFGSTCEYPGGTRVSVTTRLELDGEGKILRHTDVARKAPEATRGARDEHEAPSRVGVEQGNEKGRE